MAVLIKRLELRFLMNDLELINPIKLNEISFKNEHYNEKMLF